MQVFKRNFEQIQRGLNEKLKIQEVEKSSILQDMEILNEKISKIQDQNFSLKKENKVLLSKVLNLQEFSQLQDREPNQKSKAPPGKDQVESFFLKKRSFDLAPDDS